MTAAAPEPALFDIEHTPPPIPEHLSADRKRTLRQAATIANGGHPLGLVIAGIRRHPDTLGETYEKGDPKGRTLTCGTCIHRRSMGYHTASYPKCDVGGGNRMSHGAGTDIRSYYPGCTDWEVAE